jgi:hypothetical protein
MSEGLRADTGYMCDILALKGHWLLRHSAQLSLGLEGNEMLNVQDITQGLPFAPSCSTPDMSGLLHSCRPDGSDGTGGAGKMYVSAVEVAGQQTRLQQCWQRDPLEVIVLESTGRTS